MFLVIRKLEQVGFTKSAAYLTVLLLILSGCKELGMEYNSDKITIVSVEQNENKVKISYRAIMETLYFCPGVLVNETADNIEISFVRCGIKSECPVTLKAQQGEEGIDVIEIDNKGLPIIMVYEGGKNKLFPN